MRIINNTNKKILITHTDLDGAGCAICFKLKYPNIRVEYHNYDDIEETAIILLNQTDRYEHIYFADISPEEELGSVLLTKDNVTIIDHHKTREYLKKLTPNTFRTDYSATYLTYEYLFKDTDNLIHEEMFFKSIDAWDSWKLQSKYRRYGEKLNLLFGYYGMDKFVKEFKEMRGITDEELVIIKVLEKMKKDYLKKKTDQMVESVDEYGNKFFQFYIGESQSGIGNLLEMIDMEDKKYVKVINLNDKIVSLYSKDNFDVSIIAKKNGGGGHQKAAGYLLK